MIVHLAETRKYLVGLLSRDLQVQRISTEIDLFAPAKLACGSNRYPFKRFWIVPLLEHAFADQMREVHDTGNAIGVPETELVAGKRLCMN
jgi:hypothetical protein